MARLVLDGLTKSLSGKVVIDNMHMAVESGEMICLLGPSGSGKTTTLRMIGGFIDTDEGQISIGDLDITRMPPERRPTAMVFQQYALWPHMDVYKNISFGLKLRGLPRKEIADKVQSVLKMVGLAEYAKAYPGQLSGGQQQRVALARALVLEPQLLLLDEPLSNLDAQLRIRVREDIREIQQRAGITTVFVTHDQDEAMSIADRVAVLSNGRIEQFDTPQNLYRRPTTRFVASFIGTMNLVRGKAEEGGVVLWAKASQDEQTYVPCVQPTVSVFGELEVAIRPEDVRVSDTTNSSSDDGALATVLRRVPRGHYDELVLKTGYGELRAFVPSALSVGDAVRYQFDRVLYYQNDTLMEAGKDQNHQMEGIL